VTLKVAERGASINHLQALAYLKSAAAQIACVIAAVAAALYRSKTAQRQPEEHASRSPRCSGVASSDIEVVASTKVMTNPYLVQNIIDFIGPGQHLSISTISKLVRQCYAKVETIDVPMYHDGPVSHIVVSAQMTRYSAMCTSKSRLTLAVQCGAQFTQQETIITTRRTADHRGSAACGTGAKSKFELTDAAQCRDMVLLGRFADKAVLALAYEQLSLPTSSAYVTMGAVMSGDLAKLLWLHLVMKVPLCIRSSTVAARYGHMDILAWLYQMQLSTQAHHPKLTQQQYGGLQELWHNNTCRSAVIGGHLEALQWLGLQGRFHEVSALTRTAAECGHIHILDWLRRRQRARLDATVMEAAASAGQLIMCQHLRSIGCAWDDFTCYGAAANGHVSVLSWLRDSGCPCNDGFLVELAASGGSIPILQYILEQRMLRDEFTQAELLSAMLARAGASSKLAAAKWLRQQGAEWPAIAAHWTGEVLEWARAEGYVLPLAQH
jgi:hypothetical protein